MFAGPRGDTGRRELLQLTSQYGRGELGDQRGHTPEHAEQSGT